MDDLPFVFQTASNLLDTCGLECPQPVLECRMNLRQMGAGQILHLTADDPNTGLDIEVYCMRSGNALLATHTGTDGYFHYLIRKQNRSTAEGRH